ISPDLLEQLDQSTGPVERKLAPVPREDRTIAPVTAESFAADLAADAMANEQLAEGIAAFAKDLAALRNATAARLRDCAPRGPPPTGMKKAAPRAAFFFARDPRSPDKRSASGNTQERVILETPDAPRGLRPGHADSRNRSLDLHAAEAVVPRGHGASRPWMACARALEPRTA